MKYPKKYGGRTAAAAALLAVSVSAAAVPMYTADIRPLNGSGVSGNATFALDNTANTLNVTVNLSGLVPGYAHAQHIHGPLSGPMGESGTPLPAQFPSASQYDTNNNGYVELTEAAMAYGEVLLPLSSPAGGGVFSGPFPTALADGTASYDQTFQLGDSSIYNTSTTTGQPFDESQLLLLDQRAINIHGMNVPAGIMGQATAGYNAMIPAASGLIRAASAAAIPEPGDFAMLALGVGLIGGLSLRRRRSGGLPSFLLG